MSWTFYKSDGQSLGSPGVGWTFYKADGSTLSAAATVTEAANVTVSANNSTDETTYPAFVDGATGTQGIETDTGLTYNPSSGTLTSTVFVGALTGNVTGNTSGSAGSATGNAATATALATARDIGGTSFDGTSNIAVALSAVATEATNVTASANNSTDETVYPTFVDGATGTQGIETDTGLTYNPSTGALTAASFTGAVTGAVTGAASDVTVTANNSTDETVYPVFVDGATGTQGIESDTGLTYNPSTGVLTATQFTGNVTGNVTGNTSGSAGSATGNAATATALETGRTIGGTSFDGTANIAVALSAVATEATNVTASANNSTDETVYPTFVDGATGTQGVETDTGLTYNPSTGVLTATQFTGNVNGDLTGTLQTASQTNITAVGTIATGTWEGTTVAVDQGGTGATTLNNLITLGTHTTGNYAATVANATNGGTTVSNSGSETAAITIALNLNDLTAAAVNVAADSIAILDADGNVTRKESIADLATAMAGSNLTASSGQLVAGAAGAGLGLVIALS